MKNEASVKIEHYENLNDTEPAVVTVIKSIDANKGDDWVSVNYIAKTIAEELNAHFWVIGSKPIYEQ